jgi:hypothetical protein
MTFIFYSLTYRLIQIDHNNYFHDSSYADLSMTTNNLISTTVNLIHSDNYFIEYFLDQ